MPRETPVAITRRSAELLGTVIDAKPGGARRPGQDAMTTAVTEALASGQHLLVEAPTGTGKSLAYIIPAVAHTQRLRRTDPDGESARVIISTATKALQEQLIDTDLPAVADALAASGPKFTYAMLKGRSNYLCQARLTDISSAEPVGPQLFDEDDNGELDEVLEWAEGTETGDRSEIGHIADAVWNKVSISSNECPGASECQYGDSCYTEDARRRARDADIVVVNAHLYAAHLASGGHVLPRHDAVIFDEAHELEDIFVSAYSVTISAPRLYSVAALASAGGAIPMDVAKLRDLGNTLNGALNPHAGEPVRLTATPELARVLTAIHGACESLAASVANVKPTTPAGTTVKLQAVKAVSSLTDDIADALGRAKDAGAATWVEGDDGRNRLRSAQIDIAPVLARDLYPTTTVIATSATLTVGGRFDSLANRLGLNLEVGDDAQAAEYDTLVVETPFDYSRQGILYIADHLPDPTRQREAFEPAARAELATLAEAAGGRTLALFTSWAAARAAAEHLREHTDLHVLLQGEAARSALVDEFTTTDRAVLVATTSFWTGLDLHGDQCTLVVIDRIPFGRPNDPIGMARTRLCERRGGNGFSDVSLPAAAVMLSQGVGRLIRGTADRGVVAVLDRRLATARYSGLLLSTIPPLWRTNNQAKVTAALSRLDATARGDVATAA